VSRQPNYYRILSIAPSADEAEIKHAYRTLAKHFHPDRVPGGRQEWARARMARINFAYEVLSDPLRRARYDRQQGYVSANAPYGARKPGGTAWRAQRVRERSRRRRIERRRVAILLGAAVLGLLLVVTMIWFQWLGLDTSLGRCAWAIVLTVALLMILGALRLTEL
jgi:hypothetical protein